MSFPLRFALIVPEARLSEAGALAAALFGDPPEAALGNFGVTLRDAVGGVWRGGSGVARESLADQELAGAPWARLAVWGDGDGSFRASAGFDGPPEGTAWGWEATLAALGLERAAVD